MASLKFSKNYSDSYQCGKNVLIRSYSGPYFPAFALNTERYSVSRENTDQNNSKYGHFLRAYFEWGFLWQAFWECNNLHKTSVFLVIVVQ